MPGIRRKPKKCLFCLNNVKHIDYKDTRTLRKYVSDKGKIIPKRVTGNCAKHQRMVSQAVKRSRHMALIPYIKD